MTTILWRKWLTPSRKPLAQISSRPTGGGGGEDFHNYKLARPEIKAAYFGVGVGAAAGTSASTMHFDDTLLPLGVAVFENVVLRHLG